MTYTILELAALLELAERSGDHSGKLSALQGWAIRELIKVNDELKGTAAPKAALPPETTPNDEETEDETEDEMLGTAHEAQANGGRRI